MKTLIRNVTTLAPTSAINSFYTKDKECTYIYHFSYVNASLPVKNQTSLPFTLEFCLDKSFITFRVVFKTDAARPTAFIASRDNNVMVTNPNSFRLRYINGMVQVVYHKQDSLQKIFSDFYYLSFNGTLKDSKTTMNATYITRKFFGRYTRDFHVIMSSEPSEQNVALYYEWTVVKNFEGNYLLTHKSERWSDFNTGSSSSSVRLSDQSSHGFQLSERQFPGTRLSILENPKFKILDREDKQHYWLEFESEASENLIVSVPERQIREKNPAPDLRAWKQSNPYNGFETSFDLESKKSDWLYLKVRVFNDVSYLMVYLVPPSVFQAQGKELTVVYCKQMHQLHNVSDIRIDAALSSQSK